MRRFRKRRQGVDVVFDLIEDPESSKEIKIYDRDEEESDDLMDLG